MAIRKTNMHIKITLILILLLLAGNTVFSQTRPQKSSIEVRFELAKNQIFLPVFLKGKKFYMLLDTAVTPSVIDLAVAQDLGFPLDTGNAGESAGRGNNPVAVYPTEITSLRLGGKRLNTKIEAVAADLKRLSKSAGRPLHGILGYSFFNDRIIQIDYPARKVRLLQTPIKINKRNKCVETYEIPLEFLLNDIAPLTKIRVNSQEIPVTIDTGSSLILELFPEAVKQLKLEEVLKDAQKGTISGANGQADVYSSKLDSVGLGAFVLKKPVVTFADPKQLTGQRVGNLGNGFLKNFLLTFDYKNKKIIFQNRKSSTNCGSRGNLTRKRVT